MTMMIIIVARDLQMDGNKSIVMTGDLEETQVYLQIRSRTLPFIVIIIIIQVRQVLEASC